MAENQTRHVVSLTVFDWHNQNFTIIDILPKSGQSSQSFLITPTFRIVIKNFLILLMNGRRYCYLTVAGDFTPPARQMRQAPSSDTMHGPTGVRGVQAVPNSLHSSG